MAHHRAINHSDSQGSIRITVRDEMLEDLQPLLALELDRGLDKTSSQTHYVSTLHDNVKNNIAPILSCLMYSGCSVSMVLANKAIPMTLSNESRKILPDTAIILAQCMIAVILVSIAKVLGYVDYPNLNLVMMRQWLPVNLLFLAMLSTGFLSLVHSSVPMVTIFKNITNLFTVFGDWYFFKEPSSYLTVTAIAMMTIGAILAGMNDLEFTVIGYFWMIANCLCTSSYILYMRHVSSTIQLSKFGMVYYNNILSCMILLPILFFRQEHKVLMNDAFTGRTFLLANGIAGVLGFYLNFASLWCVSATSATTYAIVGSVNKVPITFLGFWLFDAKMTTEGIIFVAFATLGGFLYAYSKLPNKK